jgi:hypothetical protein
MSLPAGAAVRRLDGLLGEVVRGPRRASRGMLWVLWSDRTAAVLWQRCTLVYVARRMSTATAWEASRRGDAPT